MEGPRDEVAPLICAKNFGRHRRHFVNNILLLELASYVLVLQE